MAYLNPSECANSWKIVVRTYRETIALNNPRITAERIIDILGPEAAVEVFAVIVRLKSHDGRIGRKNRDILSKISIIPECCDRNNSNPMMYAGLDDIHTAHIDNIITEIFKNDQITAYLHTD